MGKFTISMAIFHSYFDVTRGYPTVNLNLPLELQGSRHFSARCGQVGTCLDSNWDCWRSKNPTRILIIGKPEENHNGILLDLPSGNLLHWYRKSPCFMCKSTISMVIFHSYMVIYQRVMIKIDDDSS